MEDGKRLRNFSRNDETIVMSETRRRSSDLFTAFSGTGGSRKRKLEAWAAVTAALNSQSDSGCVRTVQQVKKKYENIKSEAKRKAYLAKHPPTGGGPPTPKPSEAEQIFLDMMGDAPSVVGLLDGMESGVEEISPVEELVQEIAFASLPEPAVTGTHEISLTACTEPQEPNLYPRPQAKKIRKPVNEKGSSDILYQEVLQLEKRRIEAELLLAQVRLDNENSEHELRMLCLQKQLEKL